MRILFFIFVVILGLICCSPPRSQSPFSETDRLVTIVDIGNSDRLELGRMVRAIKKHSPRTIGIDFFLERDSLDKDTILVKELSGSKNIVQIVGLYSTSGLYNDFDSIRVSHQKFGITKHGFSGFTVQDSIFIPELPMRQRYKSEDIYAFSYVVAENSFGVSDKFKDHEYDEVPLRFHYYLGVKYNLIRNNDLLSGKFNKDDIAGKIVLMGYMRDNDDFYYTDMRRSMRINGVEIHAALIEELIRRN
jgi:hypothetical protein